MTLTIKFETHLKPLKQKNRFELENENFQMFSIPKKYCRGIPINFAAFGDPQKLKYIEMFYADFFIAESYSNITSPPSARVAALSGMQQ